MTFYPGERVLYSPPNIGDNDFKQRWNGTEMTIISAESGLARVTADNGDKYTVGIVNLQPLNKPEPIENWRL